MGLFEQKNEQKASEWAVPNVAVSRDTNIGENFSAAWDATWHNDTSNALTRHRKDAYDRRLAMIKDLTGTVLENPYEQEFADINLAAGGPAAMISQVIDRVALGSPEERRERAVKAHEAELAILLDRLPDEQKLMIQSREQIETEIAAEAKRLERKQQDIGARGGVGGMVGALGGGMAAVMTQPEQLATLPLGAPMKLGLLARIATEAAINAGIETAMQPAIQRQRGEMGLEAGVQKGLENIGLAAAGGAVFAGGMEGIRALARGGHRAWQAKYGRPPTASEASVLDAAQQALEVETVAPFEQRTAATAAVHQANQEAATVAAIEGRPVTQAELQGQELPRRAPVQGGDSPGGVFLGTKDILAIETDAKLMQFKAGGDEHGVTDRLAGVTEWEPERAGVLMVYEFADGKRIIADGHQRLGLAKRLAGEGKEVEAFGIVMREIDGVTPAQARVRAALKNMAEGTGTAGDAAKVLRDSGRSLAELNLPPRSAILRDAEGLSKVNDDVFGMVINEQLDERFGAAIGRMVKDELLQTNIAGLLARVQPNTLFEAEQVIDQARRAGVVHSKQEDLFGETDVAESLYLERARVLERAQRLLRQDANTFRTLLDRGDEIADAGNVLDQTQNAARLANDQKVMQFVRSLANRKGPISDALTDAAAAAKASGNYAGAARSFLGGVNERLDDSEYAGLAGRGDWGADEFTAPQGTSAEVDPRSLVPDDDTLNLFADPHSPAATTQTDRLQREIAQAVSDSDGGFALPEKGQAVSLQRRPADQVARIEAEFKARAPERSIEQYHADATGLQAELDVVGKKLGRRKGVTFHSPGVKKLATAIEKMSRKGYSSTRELTDVVRAGFEVETPAQADALVATLAKNYRVLDEGFKANGQMYFDRKVMVQFDDGTIGEIQIWQPDLLKAKKAGGGSKLYNKMRSLERGSPEYLALERQQMELYGAAIDQLSPDWLDAVWVSSAAWGGSGGTLGKIWPNIDGATGVPDSRTSSGSAGSQSEPPLRTNSADADPNTTAGRPSQLKNDVSTNALQMDNSDIGTLEAIAQGLEPPVPAGHVRFYHGGVLENMEGPRWMAPDRAYAANFRNADGDKPLSFVDIPEDDPAAIAARAWDEVDEAGQTNMVGRYINTEMPEEWAMRLDEIPRQAMDAGPGPWGLQAEPGAEGLPQTLLPGVAPVREADRLALDANRSLDASRDPATDFGLFGDEANQLDLLTSIRSQGQNMRGLEIPIGERIDADGNRVAEVQTLGDLLDELDADDEFLKQLAICDRSAR